MKCLYVARFVRFDLLWPTGNLARTVSKWIKACDRRLHRLMCYLHSTLDHSLEAFIGDAPEDCHVLGYVDASFADDVNDSKSTSGMFIAIVGPHTFVPITAFSKRQNAVSHRSTESEIVVLEEAVRSEGLPTLTFWEHVVMLFGKPNAQTARATATVEEPQSNTLAPTGGLRNTIPSLCRNTVPSFETFMAQQLCDYKQLLEKEGRPDAAARMKRATAHVSTINIGAHAYYATQFPRSRHLWPTNCANTNSFWKKRVNQMLPHEWDVP